jgi:hypothetical protein
MAFAIWWPLSVIIASKKVVMPGLVPGIHVFKSV